MSGPKLLIAVASALLVALILLVTPADPDLWGNLAFGRDVVVSGTAAPADRYSFTSDRPWTNHEWLSEVLFFEVYDRTGATGLIAFKVLLTVLMLALVAWGAWRAFDGRCDLRIPLVVALVGTHWRMNTVRPQLFSVLLFAALLTIVTEVDRGHRRWLLAVPALTAFWANLHGGWVVGVGVFGLWTAMRFLDPRATSRERLELAGVGLATLAATLVNPYGIRLWAFVGETVRFERSDIEEWLPIFHIPIAFGPWLFVLAAAGWALWKGGRSARPSYLAMVIGLALASFRVSRLDAFFTVAVVILLGSPLQASWTTFAGRRGQEPASRTTWTPGFVAVTAVAILAMTIAGLVLIVPAATCISMKDRWLPEPDAGRFITANRLHGRMLSWFDWGNYSIWMFGPQLQVSLDGRRETIYSSDRLRGHQAFYLDQDGAESFLRQVNPDYIWIPSTFPVVSRLDAWGWVPVFRGSISTVFARAGSGPFQLPPGPPATPRCFPGP